MTGDRTLAGGRIGIRRAAPLLASIFLGCAGIAAGSSAFAQPAPSAATAARTIDFAIPAQPLPAAINAFIRQTGWQISYSSALARGKTSSPVMGALSPSQALQRLVSGTGLAARIGGSGSAALVDPSSAAVATVGQGAIALDTIDVRSGGTDGFVARESSVGTKTNTPLIEVPQTINVVTRQHLDTQKPQTVMQAVQYVPGVNADYIGPASMGEDHYVMSRGWLVGKYLDGQRLGGIITGSYSGIDPYLLESIEVLKGPSATLYGAGSPGGILNLSSKKPTDAPLREVQFQSGSFGRIQGAFDMGGRLDADGHLLYRLTGIGRTGGTQFEHGTKDERFAIAPAFTWNPSGDTKLTVLAKYQYNPNMLGFQYLPAVGTVLPNPNGRISNRLYGGDRTQDDSWLAQAQIGYEFEHRFNDVWSVRQNPPRRGCAMPRLTPCCRQSSRPSSSTSSPRAVPGSPMCSAEISS